MSDLPTEPDLLAEVYTAALAAGAYSVDAWRLATARVHPVNWRDWTSVRVWCCDGFWLATWTNTGEVGLDVL